VFVEKIPNLLSGHRKGPRPLFGPQLISYQIIFLFSWHHFMFKQDNLNEPCRPITAQFFRHLEMEDLNRCLLTMALLPCRMGRGKKKFLAVPEVLVETYKGFPKFINGKMQKPF
jgi:hypothetical protein